MGVAVSAAAKRLGVGERRVRALIDSGLLEAQRVSGVYLVDDRSLDQLAVLEVRPRVRPFSRRIAWAAAELADGGRASFVSDTERSRLRSRLSRGPVSTAGWVSRLRERSAATTRYRVGPKQLAELLSDPEIWLSGAQASSNGMEDRLVTDTADLWLATPQQVERLADRWALLPSQRGNVTLRCAGIEGLTRLGSGESSVYRLVAAADLLTSDNSRARAAGEDLLAQIQNDRSWAVR